MYYLTYLFICLGTLNIYQQFSSVKWTFFIPVPALAEKKIFQRDTTMSLPNTANFKAMEFPWESYAEKEKGQPEGELVSHKEICKLQRMLDPWWRQDHTLTWTAYLCVPVPSI